MKRFVLVRVRVVLLAVLRVVIVRVVYCYGSYCVDGIVRVACCYCA